MEMSTRALYRIFGITLVTWSIAIQAAGGVPLPQQEVIKRTENVTQHADLLTTNVSLSSEIIDANGSVDDVTQSSASSTDDSQESDATTPSVMIAKSLVTALPTSEYVELMSFENSTKLFKNSSDEATTEAAMTPYGNPVNQLITIMSNGSTAKENSTSSTESVLANRTKSVFLNETITLSNETDVKPDIVTVLDNIVNYDSMLSNFMKDNITTNTNTTELPSNALSTTTTSPETTTANISSPSWKKYNTIIRKRTTKTKTDTTTEIPTTTAETITVTKNVTVTNVNKSKNNNNGTIETLEVVASTWNRTTFSPTVRNATQAREVDENGTTPMTTATDQLQALLKEAETGVLESKRSGYIDNSKLIKDIYITSSPETTAVTEKETDYGNLNNGFELNSTAMSRQQMIEDALIEERLRERLISITELTTTSTTEGQNITSSKQNASINPLLYRVNSNYKPLKKLEVQPHKSFTIDPDDNSWRNESINSRGIVYKPKNSSKPFTQVLKNKTESEWHNILEKEFKDEEVELKDRLEKIAAKRKSKKKLYNVSESSSSTELQQKEDLKSTTPYLPIFNQIMFTTNTPTEESITSQVTEKNQYENIAILTEKPMEHLNNADAYDTYDEDDRLVTVTEFDLMKTTTIKTKVKTPSYPQKAFMNTEKTTIFPHYTTHYPPNRKGTIEYFPPKTTKVNFNNYDFQFKDKINTFTTDFMKNRLEPLHILTTTPRPPPVDKNVAEPSVYIMPPYETKPADAEEGTFVIKQYKEFVSAAAAEALRPRGVVHKFVDSFNRNADKLKEEFPILYNTNIVHRDDGRIVASSSAYLRRLHGSPPPLLQRTRIYDPTCANRTVDLSPAYELHYFINDEEQKQPAVMEPPLYPDFA